MQHEPWIVTFYFGTKYSHLMEKLGSAGREKKLNPGCCCDWCNGVGDVWPALELLAPTKYNLDAGAS